MLACTVRVNCWAGQKDRSSKSPLPHTPTCSPSTVTVSRTGRGLAVPPAHTPRPRKVAADGLECWHGCSRWVFLAILRCASMTTAEVEAYTVKQQVVLRTTRTSVLALQDFLVGRFVPTGGRRFDFFIQSHPSSNRPCQ